MISKNAERGRLIKPWLPGSHVSGGARELQCLQGQAGDAGQLTARRAGGDPSTGQLLLGPSYCPSAPGTRAQHDQTNDVLREAWNLQVYEESTNF